MNLLVNKLKDKVDINGIEYNIDLDFRNFILLEAIVSSEELSEFNKVAAIYYNFYGDQQIPDVELAITKVMEIYLSSGSKASKQEVSNSESAELGKKVIDFEHDASYIYAAFMEQYGIDLNSIDFLHWWKFKALLGGLNENIKYSKIIYYRSVKINSKMPKEEKNFLKKMKKIYALPDNRSAAEIESDFHNVLGGLL